MARCYKALLTSLPSMPISPACAMQVVLPQGYLRDVYDEMREEEAVCVADEVCSCLCLVIGQLMYIPSRTTVQS